MFTLEDVTKYDSFAQEVYSKFVTVKEAKTIGYIPESFHSSFPDKCVCGSEYVVAVRDNKEPCSQIRCVNPECFMMKSCRLENLFDRFGIAGFGEEKSIKLYTEMKRIYGTPYIFEQLCKVDVSVMNLTPALDNDFRNAITTMKSRNLTFTEMLKMVGIPGLNTKADKYFKNITTFEKLVKSMKEGEDLYFPMYFFNQLGISDSMLAYSIYTNLLEIYYAIKFFGVKNIKATGKTVKFCPTGPVMMFGRTESRSNLEVVLNEFMTVDGVRLITFIKAGSVTKDTDIVIADKAGSTKYKQAVAKGKRIMTGNQLIEYLTEIKNKILQGGLV